MKTKNFNGYQNIVGKNIKKYRELKGLSQRELANRVALLGVTLYNSDISRIENNTLFIRDYEEYAICKVLGITISQLHEDSDKFFN
ncbi:MAG: helix-turn-helix transcriptional regulator [Clostridia bacterium]|nr:helix-turn-helix transcriptional regulator [Clostridia bacterium]